VTRIVSDNGRKVGLPETIALAGPRQPQVSMNPVSQPLSESLPLRDALVEVMITSGWLKITGPNLRRPKLDRKRSIIKQFGWLFSA
jgi:hypothetical protein